MLFVFNRIKVSNQMSTTLRNFFHSSLSQSDSYMSVEISGGTKAISKCSNGVSFNGSFDLVRKPIRSAFSSELAKGKGFLNTSSQLCSFATRCDIAGEGDPTSLGCEEIKLSSSVSSSFGLFNNIN